jgi:hypothetical protein
MQARVSSFKIEINFKKDTKCWYETFNLGGERGWGDLANSISPLSAIRFNTSFFGQIFLAFLLSSSSFFFVIKMIFFFVHFIFRKGASLRSFANLNFLQLVKIVTLTFITCTFYPHVHLFFLHICKF